ncbi:hypothetical protein [Saccharopolyspora mangrovi]|uniref:Transmembrane protein n=1 Tax=Saccharopolyspora mangrovi TaxID=3082379 RepID=A0ABU6AJ64_9PSEU|nr:hypothetical protein [Saccharopolyspora sp. S2-29]MEB3371355.1 hypothetical protein [Saccharopolyspora sp. S2-29]
MLEAEMERRTDIPAEAVRSSSATAIITEWTGRVAAMISIVLFVLVMFTVQKGLAVQHSAQQVVHNFHTANDYFSSRADFAAAAQAKNHLQRLYGVLSRLNETTEKDVNALSATLPDVARLLEAGRGDVALAQDLRAVADMLQQSAGSLNSIARDAHMSVSQVNSDLSTAVDLVGKLNAQLATMEQKLALLPSTGR